MFSIQFNSALFISCQIITMESGQGALYCTGKILQDSGENHNHQSALLWQALCDGGKEKPPFKRMEHLANWLGRRWGRGWKRKEKRTGKQDNTRSNEVRRQQMNDMRQCYTKTWEWKKNWVVKMCCLHQVSHEVSLATVLKQTNLGCCCFFLLIEQQTYFPGQTKIV